MANTNFLFPMTVRLNEIDVRAEASCASLFRYFEETAIQGSARLMTQGRAVGVWQIEMHSTPARETLLRAETTMVRVNAANRVVPRQSGNVRNF